MTNFSPSDPEQLLTRTQTGAALRAAGYPVADKTLSTKASRGNGPAYRRFGSRALYRWADALDWAKSRTREPIRSTSEIVGHPSQNNFRASSKPARPGATETVSDPI